MVKILMGLKGSGKTKQLIELIHKAIDEEQGDVVVIEKGAKLTYDIPHKARLIDSSQYDFGEYDFFKGFISGINSANYDITHIFVAGLLKITSKSELDEKMEEFFDWCNEFSKKENVKFTFTVSAEANRASDAIKKYL